MATMPAAPDPCRATPWRVQRFARELDAVAPFGSQPSGRVDHAQLAALRVEQAHAEQALREQPLESLDVGVHDLVGVHDRRSRVRLSSSTAVEHLVRTRRAQPHVRVAPSSAPSRTVLGDHTAHDVALVLARHSLVSLARPDRRRKRDRDPGCAGRRRTIWSRSASACRSCARSRPCAALRWWITWRRDVSGDSAGSLRSSSSA